MTTNATKLCIEKPASLGSVRTIGSEAARYLVVSIVALLVDCCVLWIVERSLQLPIWLAGAAGYCTGLVLIYLLSIHWIFRRRVLHAAPREFAIFALLGIVGIIVNSTTLSLATNVGFGLREAKAFAAGVGFVSNFVSRKLVLFTGHEA